MRKVFGPLVLVSVALIFAAVELRSNDHDDASPVQAGYAIVTPTSANASGMVVFETFGLRRGQETPQAGLFPSDMTTQAMVFVSTEAQISRNLGVALANPSSTAANITLVLHGTDGTVLGTKTFAMTAHQQTARFVTELFAGMTTVPTNVTGTLYISSDIPVAMVGLRFRGANFSTLPITSLAAAAAVPQVSAGVGGTGAVILPQFSAGGGWASEIVITNTSSASITVRADLFKPDGSAFSTTLNGTTASSFTSLTIPAGGVIVLAPRNSAGDDDF